MAFLRRNKHNNFEKYALQRAMDGQVSNKFREIFNKNIDIKDKKLKVLDSGCGDGKYYFFLKNIFKDENIFGVEVSKERIKRCHEKGFKNATYIEVNQELPFRNNLFDVIISDQIIEHISKENIPFYLSELRRVLKPKGKIILLTPNYPIKRLYDVTYAFLFFRSKGLFDDPTHVTFFSFKSLRKTLGKYFKNIELISLGGIYYNILFKNNFFSRKILAIIRK
ncbi:MAG: methyltransferase domain-containing protein [Candidatus Woesearchaeota archaeon]|jgi:ubiquinone/menaquinone biosynthesis C-methylase UbiE|nr:methyltransferase domain-containing protein [Candidatus Woesearchaeota archaeon]